MTDLTHTRCECAATCQGTRPCRCAKKGKTAQWIVERAKRQIQVCEDCKNFGDKAIMMVVSQAYKIEVRPTPEQTILFWQHCGLDRFVYNWALGERRAWWEANRNLPKKERSEEPTYYKLSARWTKEHPEWSSALCRRAVEPALKAVDFAFSNFFRRLREGTRPFGYPKFKKRGECRDSFSIQVQDFWDHVQPWAFKLDKIGMIETTEALVPVPSTAAPKLQHRSIVETSKGRDGIEIRRRRSVPIEAELAANPKGRWIRGLVNRVAISRSADKWYAAIMVTRTRPIPVPVQGPIVGVDLGISNTATCSDGRVFEGSDHLERKLKKLRRMQRKLQRQRDAKPHGAEPSGEYRAQLLKVAKLHKYVADSREVFLHKITHELATTASTVVTEGFNVRSLGARKGPTRGKQGATERRRRIMTTGMGEIRRQLDYKTKWYGSTHIMLDGRTDQTCSACGTVNEHMVDNRSDRFDCTSCGHHSTRQKNTADLLERIGRGDPPHKEAAQ